MRRRTKHGGTAGSGFDEDGLVSLGRQNVVHVRGQSLVTRHIVADLLGHVPAVLQVLVVELGGFELAGQFSGNRAHDGRKNVGEPLVRSLLEGHVLHTVCGTPRVNVTEEPTRLVLADIHAGQAHELTVVMAGVDHLG